MHKLNLAEMLQSAETVWDNLSAVPINEDDEIEEEFMCFDKGTNRQEIWSWWEERFQTYVGKFE